jgi:hypothetical protein
MTQVFQADLSARGHAIGQIVSPRVRVSFEESLPFKPSKIAVKGSAVGDWSKQDANIVGS